MEIVANEHWYCRLAKDPNGEWWELFDNNHKLPYYYNTVTKKTAWKRPTEGLVIPLSLLQKKSPPASSSVSPTISSSTASAHFSKTASDQYSSSSSTTPFHEQHQNQTAVLPANAIVTGVTTGASTKTSPMQSPAISPTASTPVLQQSAIPRAAVVSPAPGKLKSPTIVIPLPKSAAETPEPARTTSPTRSRHSLSPSIAKLDIIQGGYELSPIAPSTISNVGYDKTSSVMSAPVDSPSIRKRPDSMPITSNNSKDQQSSFNGGGQRLSMNSVRSLPQNLKEEISQFQIEGFAAKYFSTHRRRGIFRRRVPIDKMTVWSKDAISEPLMILNKALHKDAIKCFKEIQRIMGDRSGSISKTSKSANNEDYQFLCDKGIFQGELRDEIYVQLVKQLKNNPSQDSLIKGWELMSVLVTMFPPSKNFEEYLKSFIAQMISTPTRNAKIDAMTKFSGTKLARICRTGPRGKTPSLQEIERARSAPFNPSVFGETLDDIMKMTGAVDPSGKLPRILIFLADAVIKLNGHCSEGIFRVPGDVDGVGELRLRIENSNYSMDGITDPNIPASLLKFWLRDLADPLIPSDFYSACIKAPDAATAIAIVNKLPTHNRSVVLYMIRFLQKVGENAAITKMTVNNLAMVFAPNFLRCPSDNPQIIFENTKYEQTFLRLLINSSDLPKD